MLGQSQTPSGPNHRCRRTHHRVIELKNIQIYDQAMAARGIDVGPRERMHMTQVGPPGTAKTSVARIICEMYYGLGILESLEFIEVSRNDLVAHTSAKPKPKPPPCCPTPPGGPCSSTRLAVAGSLQGRSRQQALCPSARYGWRRTVHTGQSG